MGIRIFNSLPFDIKAFTNNVKQIIRALNCLFSIILFITGIFWLKKSLVIITWFSFYIFLVSIVYFIPT